MIMTISRVDWLADCQGDSMTLYLHHYRYDYLKIEIEAPDEDACWVQAAEICRQLHWDMDDIWTEKGD